MKFSHDLGVSDKVSLNKSSQVPGCHVISKCCYHQVYKTLIAELTHVSVPNSHLIKYCPTLAKNGHKSRHLTTGPVTDYPSNWVCVAHKLIWPRRVELWVPNHPTPSACNTHFGSKCLFDYAIAADVRRRPQLNHVTEIFASHSVLQSPPSGEETVGFGRVITLVPFGAGWLIIYAMDGVCAATIQITCVPSDGLWHSPGSIQI